MFARVSYFQQDVNDLDESMRLVQEQLVPQIEAMPGCLGMQALMDRATGRSLAITYWESEEALQASEEAADRIREDSRELTGSKIEKVERYEVAFRVGI